MKILLVDSDRDMVEMLSGWMKSRGYDVSAAFSADRARLKWLEQRPDLVIIDTALKDGDALALCRDLRAQHDALVLVTTVAHDVQAEIRSLESGADDFLPKPYFPSQLQAHIRALSRRVRSTIERRPSFITTVGPLRVDSLRNEVTLFGRTQRLTPTESKVLHMLALNANDVCTLSQIVSHVWGYDESGDTALVKAHIRHLREKIEPDPSSPKYIVTLPGAGYMMVRHSDEQARSFAAASASAPLDLQSRLQPRINSEVEDNAALAF
jgi:DNA-binding response OmpR family regulator